MMRKKLAFAFIALFAFAPVVQVARSQDNQQPLTKQEIISLIKQSGARKLSQTDIIAEVERRGIAFTPDDKVLSELRENGAHTFLLEAIKRASNGPAQPPQPQAGAVEAGDEEARKKMEEEQVKRLPLIEQARYHALNYTEELPNFIVNQTVSRYVRTPNVRDWRLEDTLDVELTYIAEKGEQFKVLRINGKPTNQSYEQLGGSTSTGEFGSLLASLFAPQSRADFKEVKNEMFNGRQTVLYDFTVKQVNSNSILVDKTTGQKATTGYTGSIWIDAETKQPLRIESSNEGMPAGFPITLAESAVEYDYVTISGERFLLPVRAELILGRDRDRFYSRNVIEFRNYKKFEGKIVVQ